MVRDLSVFCGRSSYHFIARNRRFFYEEIMKRSIHLHDLTQISPAARADLLCRTESDLAPYMAQVQPVIDAVEKEGDVALIRYAQQFDGAVLSAIRVAEADIAKAPSLLSPSVMEAIDYGLENIRAFHEHQKPKSWWKEIAPGCHAGERWSAIESVACYVPRGKGSFPSVAMMTATPAVVAGVKNIAIFTPPGKDGQADIATMAVASRLGISHIYRAGGAQAVAAAAFGTKTIPHYDKIVGPGSPYFMAAKKLLNHRIDPGIPAGPSEALVLADESADPELVMRDLLIEAEHGPDSSCFLVTWSASLADACADHYERLLQGLSEVRAGYAHQVLGGEKGGIVLAPDRSAALSFVNDYAAEHLLIHSAEPFSYVEDIHHAGEILLGRHTPNTLANFVLGPNAVLPTSGTARIASALSTFDFMKRTSLGYVTGKGYAPMAEHARILAEYEGFDAHAQALISDR